MIVDFSNQFNSLYLHMSDVTFIVRQPIYRMIAKLNMYEIKYISIYNIYNIFKNTLKY